MNQGTLVAEQIEDGRRFLDRLSNEGIAVTAAAWVKEDEYGPWFFYLITPLASERGGTMTAYDRVNTVLRQVPQPFWVDPMEYKVIAPDSAVGRAVRDLHRQYPGLFPRWYREPQLGGMPLEGAYIYPPISVPTARAET